MIAWDEIIHLNSGEVFVEKRACLLNRLSFILFFAGFVIFIVPPELIKPTFTHLSSVFTGIAGLAGLVFVFTGTSRDRRDPILWGMALLLILHPILG